MPSVHKVDPKSRDLLEDHHPCRWASRLPKMTGWQAARRDRGAGGDSSRYGGTSSYLLGRLFRGRRGEGWGTRL